jgi:hypothetical protein
MLILILALTALKTSTATAEYVFARGFSRAYIFVVGHITELFPFSVFEILCGIAIIAGIVSIVRWCVWLRRKKFYKIARGLSRATVILLGVILTYTATASCTYYRASIQGHIPASENKPGNLELMEMVDYFVDDFNALAERMPRDEEGNVLCPYTFADLAEKIREEYRKLDDRYFSPYSPGIKKLISGEVIQSFNILGISFQPTAEANIVNNAVPIDLPFLMAHELAHSKGIMREDDANLTAAYITLNSEDDYIRYSGYANYYYSIYQFISLNMLQNRYYEAQYSYPSARIHADYRHRNEVYSAYPDITADIGEFINNLYLKMSGIKEGTDSYDIGGNVSILPTEPGEPVRYEVCYSLTQKMMIASYERLMNAQ